MKELKDVNRFLFILALRAKFRGLKPSISDYHRDLKGIFGYELCYSAVRKRLRKLEQLDILRSNLVKGFVRNDLVDSKGEIKLRRHTKVFQEDILPERLP